MKAMSSFEIDICRLLRNIRQLHDARYLAFTKLQACSGAVKVFERY